jgi:hypothetical protein
MNTILKKTALVALLILASSSAAAGGVSVKFANAEGYADMPFAPWEREELLKGLGEHFAKLGARMPANEELQIEVTDFDPAGRIRHSHRYARELRVMTGGADWPHMELKYTHLRDGQVLASGTETINDMNYLHRMNRYVSGDMLRYEKRMIDEWFKDRIAAR